jgi:hypothetical protein
MAAISMGLEEGAMDAVVDLIARLARKNPRKAALLLDFINLTAATERAAALAPPARPDAAVVAGGEGA